MDDTTGPQSPEQPQAHGSVFVSGWEFLIPLLAVLLAVLLVIAAPAQASKWQGWPGWCTHHHHHHQVMCRTQS